MGFIINLRLNFKQAPKFKTMLSRGKRILKMISQKDEKKKQIKKQDVLNTIKLLKDLSKNCPY